MRGKAPSNENKSSQDFVHVDVCENWLETHVSPGGAFYRFANDSRGIAQLINLCRQRGVSKIYMKAAGEHGARARHALTVAGLSVTAADPLRARIFADAGRSRNVRRLSTISLVGASIALGLAGLFAWQWNRAEQTVELASETTKGWLTQKLESAPGAIASFLAEVAEGDKAEQRDLTASHGTLGDARLTAGDRAAVSQSHGDNLAIINSLSAANPGDSGRRDLSIAHGEAQRAQADPATELQSSRDRMAASKASADADPGDKSRRRELAAAQQKPGDVALAQGDLAAAMQSYRDSFALNKVLSAADPGDAGLRRDLAAAHEKLGDAQLAQGDPAAALQSFRDDVAFTKTLADAATADAGRRRDLAVAYEKLGDAQLAKGDLAAAPRSYGESSQAHQGPCGRRSGRRRPATGFGDRLRKTRRRPARPRRSGGGAILSRQLRDPRGFVGGRSSGRRAAARHDRDMSEIVHRGAAQRPRLFAEGASSPERTRGQRPFNTDRPSLRG